MALSTFVHSERHIVIGAHDATIVPVLDGYATLDFGPLLPQVRLPAETVAGIGVDISLGNAEVENLDQLVARDAVIASQPEGEIAAVRDAVRDMLEAALLRGVGVGVLVAVGVALTWLAVGPERRAHILRAARHPSRTQGAVAGFVGVVVIGFHRSDRACPSRGRDARTRRGCRSCRPSPTCRATRCSTRLEIVNGSATEGSKALVQGALETYHDSVVFYGALALRAATADIRRPKSGETTALVVTDRHDNIGMDPVARAIAVRARAELLIDLGDDTSNGGSWETFSINSLAREFRGFSIVAVAGNHDQGSSVTDAMKEPRVPGARRTPRRRRRHPLPRLERPAQLRPDGRLRRQRGRQHRGDRRAGRAPHRGRLSTTIVWTCWWCTARRPPGRRPRAAASTWCCPATCTVRSART